MRTWWGIDLVRLILYRALFGGLIASGSCGGIHDVVWIPVGVSALAVVLNAISRSAGERGIWVPVATLLFVSSLLVALDV